jgi:hypothetical protein
MVSARVVGSTFSAYILAHDREKLRLESGFEF